MTLGSENDLSSTTCTLLYAPVFSVEAKTMYWISVVDPS